MGRNFSPARNVLSSTAPSAVRRSLVRTKAPPLPGLTCWNSRILKTVPSTSMWVPYLNWLVLITGGKARRAGPANRGRDPLAPRLARRALVERQAPDALRQPRPPPQLLQGRLP